MTREEIKSLVRRVVEETEVIDIHTHLFDPSFGKLLLWGIDELLTYHYLIAEAMRFLDMPYDDFWGMSKREQADLIWETLFVKRSPISEAARGVLTTLNKLGLDVSKRDLNAYRSYFESVKLEDYIDRVFELSKVKYVVMTNNPFDEEERRVWLEGRREDPRFKPALRIDPILTDWERTSGIMRSWGYDVMERVEPKTAAEVRRFLNEWIDRMKPVYMAASLPPTFRVPCDEPASILMEEAVLPVAEERGLPVAMMIGVKRSTNPHLRVAGDSVGKASIDSIEYLCRNYPSVKFLLTVLSRENQHELVVAARKFRNLHIFGCWWFLNNPSIVEEITRERMEMLGWSFTAQHSDARVLDQLIYKWAHSKSIIADVLTDKYSDLAETGWVVSEEEMRRDVRMLLGGSFEEFLEMRL